MKYFRREPVGGKNQVNGQQFSRQFFDMKVNTSYR